MTDESKKTVIVYACSGCSDAGEIADHIARRLTCEGVAQMSCLAGIGGRVKSHTGIGLGSAIAVVCSWQRNRSILWMILAGILSWFYVIYFALTRRPGERFLKP
jgi:hypothetical protein